jgi:hypothetical protein
LAVRGIHHFVLNGHLVGGAIKIAILVRNVLLKQKNYIILVKNYELDEMSAACV